MSSLIKKLQNLPNFYSMTGASEEDIADAEQALGIKFAKDYREYVHAFGVISADGHELTGICKSKRLNVVSVTASEKTYNPNIPEDWYVIEQANIDGIVIWQASTGDIYQTGPGSNCCKIADSLQKYMLK